MTQKVVEIGGEAPTNGAVQSIEYTQPFVATVRICGTADILFHRWNCEAVERKGSAAKGSKAKKTDDLESYVYRNDDGYLCIPGEYLRQSIIMAAKFRQDPRSPRKSAMDLFKAGIVSLTVLAPALVGSKKVAKWEYEHMCRVTIQRAGITRCRPALKAGWEAEFQLMSNLPEYIRPNDLHDVIGQAGKLIGLADFRPTYGRFRIDSFDVGLE